MNWKNLKAPFKALIILAICAISIISVVPIQKTIHLGLDLQGGARLLLQLSPTAEVPTITAQIQAQTREVIDRRINGLGVAEPSISNVGTDRILVELPAVKDPDQAEQVLKQVAVLEYKIVPFEVMQKADAANAQLLQPNLAPKKRPPPSSTLQRPRTTRAATSSTRAKTSRRRRRATIRPATPTSRFRPRMRRGSAS